jgi:broad specificity phosphatase PhoE
MNDKQLTLILVRVGPTTWDAQGRLCGCSDVPPAPGCIEALRTAMGVAEPDIEMVLHGPGEASQALALALGSGTETKVKSLQGLTEIGLGLWEGMLEDQAEHRYPTLYRQWRLDPSLASPPEGEPIDEAQERLLAAIRKGVGRVPAKGRTAAILLRPLAFAAILAALEGMPTSSIWGWVEGPERVRRVTVPGGDLRSIVNVRARIGA